MKNAPKLEDFKMEKVKLLKAGGLTVTYDTPYALITNTVPDHPHSDLMEKLTDLQSFVGEVFSIDKIEKINPTGIILSGTEENEAVTITAKIITEAGIDVGVSTHRIKFDDGAYGNENILKEVCDKLREEVYQYLFKEKRSQLSMFDESEEDE